MENPYNEELWTDDGPNGMRHKPTGTAEVFYTDSELTAAFDAWNECYAALQAGHSEIVSGLVKALQEALEVIDRECPLHDAVGTPMPWPNAVVHMAAEAIAKAKGE